MVSASHSCPLSWCLSARCGPGVVQTSCRVGDASILSPMLRVKLQRLSNIVYECAPVLSGLLLLNLVIPLDSRYACDFRRMGVHPYLSADYASWKPLCKLGVSIMQLSWSRKSNGITAILILLPDVWKKPFKALCHEMCTAPAADRRPAANTRSLCAYCKSRCCHSHTPDLSARHILRWSPALLMSMWDIKHSMPTLKEGRGYDS